MAVVGARGLDALVVLCREGFQHVTCCCSGAPGACGERSGVLLVAGPLADVALAAALHAAAPALAQEASVVVELAGDAQREVVERALTGAGFEVRAEAGDRSAPELARFRIVRAARLARAA